MVLILECRALVVNPAATAINRGALPTHVRFDSSNVHARFPMQTKELAFESLEQLGRWLAFESLEQLGRWIGVDLCIAADIQSPDAFVVAKTTEYRVPLSEIVQLRARGADVYVTTDPASAARPSYADGAARDLAALREHHDRRVPQSDHAAMRAAPYVPSEGHSVFCRCNECTPGGREAVTMKQPDKAAAIMKQSLRDIGSDAFRARGLVIDQIALDVLGITGRPERDDTVTAPYSAIARALREAFNAGRAHGFREDRDGSVLVSEYPR